MPQPNLDPQHSTSPHAPHEENPIATEESFATLSSGGTPQKSLKNPILGIGFLAISVLGVIGLISAALPTNTPPQTQAAAVSTPEKNAFSGIELEATSAVVFDVRSGTELFTKNATAQLPLASITKIALVLVVAEVLDPETYITISEGAVQRGGGGLTWGEEWKVRDLIDFTLITSSNTGAEALAEAAEPLLAQKYKEGSQKNATVWRMNALAQSIGMNETYFINATGLDESTTQAGAQSSARDIAALFDYALRISPELFSGTIRDSAVLAPDNFPERSVYNTNNALADIPGILMGKTGTTDLAGGNLAIAFNAADSHPVVVVVLGSSSDGRFSDVKKLVDAARKVSISN